MNRQNVSLLAVAGVVVLVSGTAAAQAPKPATSGAPAAQGTQTPPARPRLVAPVRGVAQIGYTRPVVKRGKVGGKDFVVTTMRIQNMAAAPIAGLKVDDFWYDKQGNPLPSDSYRHPRPLQPGEVITVTLETPLDPRMNRNQWQFSHANGEIKPTLVPKL
ncbi:MAG: hypothetical protein A3I61_15825 [Acidobacteria bacterium RIFCSPLOWO2_02_FULL_68_18]|nr:MAG: hypothetical protein A3I61_15825 [Acidobacteria bacterium RIFCSPLOWO2_02_FULL_68_18]OFW51727.1 MAG: hypothetical protein A3G77_12670 [Acidobacteria bacterium RIFCSPLOWO2_12_FULL_68_19]